MKFPNHQVNATLGDLTVGSTLRLRHLAAWRRQRGKAVARLAVAAAKDQAMKCAKSARRWRKRPVRHRP
ncbi:hypothetical protein V8Z74_02385 [Comamonas sp. w2-DMI]|uniref:hypothetical protein n=1 Tax=Comamonas sp. w2-DMI TaxID=3126391 RepID=UPI0032E40ADF